MTGMLRDDGSDSYKSYWCYGGARWPPFAGSGDKVGGEIGGTLHLEIGVLVLPSLQLGHSCILTRLQKSDSIFNMGVDVINQVFNLEPKYKVTMLTREEWTRGPATPNAVKGLVCFTDWSRNAEGTVAWFYGQSANGRFSIL
jgi:hypothetical protein